VVWNLHVESCGLLFTNGRCRRQWCCFGLSVWPYHTPFSVCSWQRRCACVEPPLAMTVSISPPPRSKSHFCPPAESLSPPWCTSCSLVWSPGLQSWSREAGDAVMGCRAWFASTPASTSVPLGSPKNYPPSWKRTLQIRSWAARKPCFEEQARMNHLDMKSNTGLLWWWGWTHLYNEKPPHLLLVLITCTLFSHSFSQRNTAHSINSFSPSEYYTCSCLKECVTAFYNNI